MNESEGEFFHAMIDGKIRDIKRAIDEIEAEINERRDIDKQAVSEIQDEILSVRNRVLEVEQASGANEFHGAHSPLLEEMEKELQNLESEKRKESVSVWRDLTVLRKEIRFYMKELNDLLRKAKLVQNDSGRRIIEKT